MQNDKLNSFLEIYHIKDVTTEEMKEAITDWEYLYYGREEPNEDPCQMIAYTVVTKLKKTIFAEYEAESDNEFAQTVIDALDEVRKKATQQMLIGGTAMLKPLIFDKELSFSVIPRSNFIVIGRDNKNNITDIGTIEETETRNGYYTLYERRRVNEENKLEIESVLYHSKERNEKGSRVPLETLTKYEGIEPITVIPIDNIGLIPFSCPVENCIDGSDDAVSVYAAAAGLIHNINENECQLAGEFRRGESRVFVSSDLLKGTPGGGKTFTDNIFEGLDDDPENVGVNIFAPQLRDASFLARKQEYLRNVESVIGFKRGVLADVTAEERTATEITSSAGDYNLTIIDFQEEWEKAVRYAVNVCAGLFKAYKMSAAEVPEDAIVINWGNGVLYDRQQAWGDYLAMVQYGLLKPEIAIAFYFNIDWQTPKDLEKIRADYMPQMLDLMQGQI